MVRTRTGWLVAVVALGLGAGACKNKEEKKEGATTGDTKTTETKPAVVGDMTKPAVAMAAAGDDLALLPADSEVVLGLNFSQLQQSALWKQFAPALMSKASAGLNDFKTACGFDPMEAIKSVSMGMKGLGGSNPDGIVVIHGPDKGKVTACVEKAMVEAAKNGGEITVDGDVFLVKDKHGQNTAWTYVGADTLVGAVGPSASKDTLLAAAKGGSTLKTSQTFVEMYSKINTKESLWVLVNGNAPFMAQAARAGVKPKAVFGSVNVTDGLTVDMRIRLATPEEAKNLVTMAQGQTNSPQVKQMFDKLDIGADGADVKFSMAMSQQKLTALMGMMGGMLGGMMGGGGGMGAP
jgi:hypothetical protein